MIARSFDVDCTVRVVNTRHELSAHVELDGDVDVGPGDTVHVHGDAIHADFGEVLVERRRATVTRANWLAGWWVKLAGHFELLELLDVSFTDQRTL